MSSNTKQKRPALAMALASALTLALAAPAAAFAADPMPPQVADADVKTVTTTGGTQETEITGTVKATTVSVTVPTKVAFYLDPGAAQGTTRDASANKYGQYTNPTNITVTNRSAVDVYGYVSSVSSNDVTLVNSKADLKKPGGIAPGAANASQIGVMVGICDTTESMSLDTPGDWMTVAGVADTKDNRYYAFNKAKHGRLSAAQGDVVSSHDGIGGSYTMTIRGAVFQGGWSQDESFLIKPTIKIVTTDPSTVA